MQQLLLNISDPSQLDKILNLLGSMKNVEVEPYNEGNIIVSEQEKKIIRNRVNNANPEDFNNWDDFIKTIEV